MLSTVVAVPTLPMVLPYRMVTPMKQNVGSRSLTAPMGVALPPRPWVSKSMSLGKSRFITTRKEKNHSIVCSAALASRCAAASQTQTVTRKSSSVTSAPSRDKLKTPILDDGGGTGRPPYDRGGGGGGGGGGGQFSGGFFLFGLILFLSYWKEKESQGEYAEKRRQKLYQLWGRVYQ